jgi:hypothetical protein
MSSWLQPGNRAAAEGSGFGSPFGSASPRREDRGPALVELPRARAPLGAQPLRLRVPDRPGGLAGIAGHFAAHGVNVLRREVLGREAGWAIDDFLVSGGGLTAALDELGPEVTVLAHRPGVDLRDPGLAMAAACASVTAAGSARQAHSHLVSAALELVFAEAGFLCVRQGHGFLRPVASTVPGLPVIDDGTASLLSSTLFSGECLTADGRIPWAPPSYRGRLPAGAVAVVPGGSPPFLLLVLLRDDLAPFAAAELDRLAALARVAAGTLQLHDSSPR